MALSRSFWLCLALCSGSAAATSACNSEDGECLEEQKVSLLQAKVEVVKTLSNEDPKVQMKVPKKIASQLIAEKAKAKQAAAENFANKVKEASVASPMQKKKVLELAMAMKQHQQRSLDYQKTVKLLQKQASHPNSPCDQATQFSKWEDDGTGNWAETCQPRGPRGAECTWLGECMDGGDFEGKGGSAYCSMGSPSADGTWIPGKCMDRENLGSQCDPMNWQQCNNGICKGGTLNNVTWKTEGATCDPKSAVGDRCEWDGWCTDDSFCDMSDSTWDPDTHKMEGAACKGKGAMDADCQWQGQCQDGFDCKIPPYVPGQDYQGGKCFKEPPVEPSPPQEPSLPADGNLDEEESEIEKMCPTCADLEPEYKKNCETIGKNEEDCFKDVMQNGENAGVVMDGSWSNKDLAGSCATCLRDTLGPLLEGSGPPSGGHGSGPPSGASGGHGSGPPSGGHGSGPPSGSSGGQGSGPPSGGHGSGPPSGGHGSGPPSGGHGSGPPSGGRGSGPPSGRRGSGPPSGDKLESLRQSVSEVRQGLEKETEERTREDANIRQAVDGLIQKAGGGPIA